MIKICKNCTKQFEITQEDKERYKIFQVPNPTHCPECRQQRRAAQGNQLYLYKRKCDLTGKDIISNYHPKSPHKVYAQYIWHEDKWDPFEYGRDYDFSRPFFEQFKELSLVTPRPSLQTGYQFDENSDYTNYAGKDKNCYMIFDSDENRDCYYCYSINHNENSMDCYRTRSCELMYECIDCVNCYNCCYCQDSSNCSDSYFLKNCIGCKKCIMSSNLKNKEYYVKNKKVSKEEYEKTGKFLHAHSAIQDAIKMFNELRLKYPQKYMHGVQNENVFGDYLNNCKNAQWCFDSSTLWDCKYVFQGFMPLKNCMDIQECGEGERLYECAFSGYEAFDSKFCNLMLGTCSNMQYCSHSPHSANCFGCIGIRRKSYCILNKQYSKEEYNDMLSRIIKHMTEAGEYGEFYPIELSNFDYNETLAQEYFPLTKEEALKKGYGWQDELVQSQGTPTLNYKIPETIEGTVNSITDIILNCEVCNKNYKIVPQEFKLLRRMKMPIPHKCFFCRHATRRNKRNKRTMYDRNCQKCDKSIQTTYTPKQPEIIYCEECYQQSLE